MKKLFLGLMLLFGFASSAFADNEQTSLVIIACRVDDLTGQPGRHDPELAAKGWRDLELHIVNGELQCRREVLYDLQDATQFSTAAPADLIALNPDFSVPTSCARVGVVMAQAWNEQNKGWATIAVGCPVPIMSDNGTPDDKSDDYQVGLKLPECPSFLPGTDSPMRCRFDASVI
jgi:hypothetical protein